ncbi:reprolysin-like metallopeptidase [Tenacibaculum agarivorans]|uniref:reprolysin-like metallopeptidase n=1 Tax=Tenacibaculum agarivorans TaxID=1908389 RepID=UPI00094B8499|nr:zinc-dependent metalloprotease family protein [Tenacibaculum agarivorans]
MKRILFLLFLLNVSFIFSQSSWKKLNSENTAQKGQKVFINTEPKEYNLYSLDFTAFQKELNEKNKGTQKIIRLPDNSGNLSDFYIKEHTNFGQPLHTDFDFIRSYDIQNSKDASTTGKISIGADGVHVTIYSHKHKTFYIDPYTKDNVYIAYNRKNIKAKASHFGCDLVEKIENSKNKNPISNRISNDGLLRTYRLALSCTGEYAQFHIRNQGVETGSEAQQRAAVLSAMNTTMTRVNGLFERDLSVTMNIVLVGGANPLIFLDPDTDDFTNTNGRQLLDENQAVTDNIIGTANYDIGHIFSTGGGGVAVLGSVCGNFKANGVTGLPSPIGDSFNVDFVAHEIGHQFGGHHTFNGDTGNCAGVNRNNPTAVEPGSGSTIMAYAGICAPQNVQNNSDDYFHAISIQEINNFIDARGNCATTADTGNTNPTVNAGADYTVPKSTPLMLNGSATDAEDNATLTYCWEQIDNEITDPIPNPDSTGGALFRSLPPTTVTNRYFPTLQTVVNGTSSQWEVLPNVAREMNFSLLVRDNRAGGGTTGRDDVKITVADAEPFVVTSQNSAVTWDAASTKLITWDTSTTNQAPINCQNVTIKLSVDGGQTFPTILAQNVPNDGSQEITVPNNPTDEGRILVEAADNIFYNVNSANITILDSGPTFSFSNTSANQEICSSTTSSTQFVVNVDYLRGFSDEVNFSVSNLPTNATATLNPSNLTAPGPITVTINNLNNVTPQNYSITIEGQSVTTAVTRRIDLPDLTVYNDDFDEIQINFPSNNDVNITTDRLTLDWNDSFNSTSYDVQLALDNEFNTIAFSAENITDSNYEIPDFLEWGTTYYWRVRPKNICGDGAYSFISQFTTEEENFCQSNFQQVIESEFISNVSFNAINHDSGDDHDPEPDDGYQDFTSISTSLARGKTYPISVTFNTRGFQDNCLVFIDWNNDSRFNNDTEKYDLGEHRNTISTATAEITVPDNAVLGKIRMRVLIQYFDGNIAIGQGACDIDHNTESGETEDYSLVILESDLGQKDDVFSSFSLGPNPTKDYNINLSFDVDDINTPVTLRLYDYTGRLLKTMAYRSDLTFFTERIDFSDIGFGLYILQIKNGEKEVNKKIIINR